MAHAGIDLVHEPSSRRPPTASSIAFSISGLAPRPIAWFPPPGFPLSVTNVRTWRHSLHFNVVSAKPSRFGFSPGLRQIDGTAQDTLRMSRESGEFVVNVATFALPSYERRVRELADELELAKLTPQRSQLGDLRR